TAHLGVTGAEGVLELVLQRRLDYRGFVSGKHQVGGSLKPLKPNQTIDPNLGESSSGDSTHALLLTISTKGTMSSSSVIPPWPTMRLPCGTNAYRPGAIRGKKCSGKPTGSHSRALGKRFLICERRAESGYTRTLSPRRSAIAPSAGLPIPSASTLPWSEQRYTLKPPSWTRPMTCKDRKSVV